MELETTEIVPIDTKSQDMIAVPLNATSALVLGLAVVGGYVVGKKIVLNVRENIKIRREMKKLYKEHKRTA